LSITIGRQSVASRAAESGGWAVDRRGFWTLTPPHISACVNSMSERIVMKYGADSQPLTLGSGRGLLSSSLLRWRLCDEEALWKKEFMAGGT